MDFSKIFNDLPDDLVAKGSVEDYKLLMLYAYNAYYNADSVNTEEVKNGITYDRQNRFNIDGVFVNETLDENTIEVLFSYYVGNFSFDRLHVLRALDFISTIVEDVSKRRFFGLNKRAESLLTEYLDDAENKNVIIRILTDYSPDEKEKYDITKKVEQFKTSFEKTRLNATISFGDDIMAVVESNVAPYDWVEHDKLILDDINNFLVYGDDSFVCNISALSLKRLWKREGNRGLLSMNLRYYIKSANIDGKIEDSILFDNSNFWYLNNGIIIVCNEFNVVGNELRLDQFSIVNGGQTSRMIGTIPFENDFFIICKVIKNRFPTAKEKNVFISKVAEASNTQKPIKAKDIIANKVEQRDLKVLMQDNGVFIEIKRGEKYNRAIYKEPYQRTKNNELAQNLYSFVFLEPGPARNNVSTILQSEDKYERIFISHAYSFEFLRDILFLEKAYREYNKKISKSEDEDSVKQGLVKNGMHYTLATIGYLLKIKYNKEYRESIYKYRNNEAMFPVFSSELAFSHGFIDKKVSYSEFTKKAVDLFDFVFTNLVIPEFEVARSNNNSLAYSNWMKTNTGFNLITKRINVNIFDSKDYYLLKPLNQYFVSISEEQENKNIDDYVDYCKKNKKMKSKDLSGNEMSDKDATLRNELMIFRMNKAIEKHLSEKMVFTDKMIDKIVSDKPISMPSLKKIVSGTTCYFAGEEILEIITRYL